MDFWAAQRFIQRFSAESGHGMACAWYSFQLQVASERHRGTGTNCPELIGLIGSNEERMAVHKSREPNNRAIRVDASPDQSSVITHCPTCGLRLTIRVDAEGSVAPMVACARCKEVYRIESIRAGAREDWSVRAFRVSFGVEGRWNPCEIMECLFDRIGEVRTFDGGFACEPDEHLGLVPSIAVIERTRTVQFCLTGPLQEREAIAIINQAVSEFGGRFHLGLRPLTLERWEQRGDSAGLALAESRPLGMLLPPRNRAYAHA